MSGFFKKENTKPYAPVNKFTYKGYKILQAILSQEQETPDRKVSMINKHEKYLKPKEK